MRKIESEKDLEKFIKNRGHKNIGYMHHRMKFDCEQSNREKALSRLWRKENQKRHWLNCGFGVLQDLFFNSAHFDRTKIFPLTTITKRDRVIAATVVQWLGSNCGFTFLCKAMDNCGYKIVKK